MHEIVVESSEELIVGLLSIYYVLVGTLLGNRHYLL